MSTLFLVTGCDGSQGDYDFVLASLGQGSVTIKSEDSRTIDGCMILVNGAGGFSYAPEQGTFKPGETKVFPFSSFYNTTRRQFDRKVDRVEQISVSCRNPGGSVTIFKANDGLGGFLK
ncbi:hypothetical protein O4H49_17215 [Kiloniella laminariae]|uniref:Lipoprotein n=1 Tax=Kiloniella laminariae TaxID=454162 RepID=A0ABT4LN89_9PROT|nr:hypothetical protein [Kiloniella laminariae]MCZ4282531.1 hypothetical protein [Kiloniella laminariae]